MKIKSISVIYDKNDKKIFKFPNDTLLNEIFDDLWIEIIKYVTIDQFIFGISKEGETNMYPCYRKITEAEFMSQFIGYYHKNRKVPKMNNYSHIERYIGIDGGNILCCNARSYPLLCFCNANNMHLYNSKELYTESIHFRLRHIHEINMPIGFIMIFDPHIIKI